MDVTEFPHTPFYLQSLEFQYEGSADVLSNMVNSCSGSFGVFHFCFASEDKPKDDEKKDYSVESLAYFPNKWVGTSSALLDLAKTRKYSADLGQSLETFSMTGKGDLLVESVVGAGKKSDLLSTDMSTLAASVASVVHTNKTKTVAFLLKDFDENNLELFLTYFLVQLCEDKRFKKDSKLEKYIETVVVVHPKGSELLSLEKKVLVMAESVNLTRELVTAPPNYANTLTMAEFFKKMLTALGLKVKVLDFDDCKKENMFCFLAVGQGSKYPPRFLHAVYEPEDTPTKTVALVGKGIMFDSGGYNVKNASSLIHLMKFDMGGFSAVFGAANAVAKLKPRNVRVHFLSALCENMVDANSYRPSDVFRSSSGKTVEVLNTDAEGRVTLADSLYYATKLEPDYVLDYATLTGAQIVALGHKCAAYYSNDEELAELYSKAAKKAGELAWRMPLLKEYKEFLKSKLADLVNANYNAKAGSVNGALFLREFVGDTKWVHVDMAGPVWDSKAERATGYGVMSMVSFLLMLP